MIALVNAWNFLDNMDGLSSGLTAVTAAALAWIGATNGAPMAAALGAALAGAAVGFLAFNAPPARIYLGDAGSLFSGFLVSAIALDIAPTTVQGTAPLVALLVLAVPTLDIVVVSLARHRRGIPLTTGGRTHLSHRLVALGLERGHAVAVLVTVQLAAAGVGALLATDRLGAVAAACLGSAIVTLLFALTIRATVFDEPVVRMHHARAGVGFAVVLGMLAIGPIALAGESNGAIPAVAPGRPDWAQAITTGVLVVAVVASIVAARRRSLAVAASRHELQQAAEGLRPSSA